MNAVGEDTQRWWGGHSTLPAVIKFISIFTQTGSDDAKTSFSSVLASART